MDDVENPGAQTHQGYVLIDPATANLLSRNSERLAAMEQKVEKIDSFTEKVRDRLHLISENMTLFVASEKHCLEALTEIKNGMRDHTAAIQALTAARDTLAGAWRAIIATAAIAAPLAAGIAWLMTHHISIQ